MQPLLLRRPAGRGFALLLSLLLLLLAVPRAQATHLRAGDIQAKGDTTYPVTDPRYNPRKVFYTMVLYMDSNSPASNNNDETVYFGDGTRAEIKRNLRIQLPNNVYRCVYYFEHTYNAPGTYVTSYVGELRFTGVRNMTDPSSQSFYIYTRITVDPLLGLNRSPVLRAPAIDFAATNQVFLHNPAAYDADGDSLAYKLRICQREPRDVPTINVGPPANTPRPENCRGYEFPNSQSPSVSPGGVQVAYNGTPAPTVGAAATFDIDVRTGQLVWNSPSVAGEFNAAFVVEEWRRSTNAKPRLIGEVLRDMQITVRNTANKRPILAVLPDTCVVAGQTVQRTIKATDADNNLITLAAFGGMLPPATFVQQTPPVAGTATGVFRWSTSCSDIAAEPQQVLFKATDQPAGGGTPLIDERVWRIRVVGPAPAGVTAQRQGNGALLTWAAYTCYRPGVVLHVYRKEGPSGFNPGPCQTGIPASTGFVRIASIAGNLTTYLDTRGTQGLERGKTYCYRLYAEFPLPAGGESLASAEACVTFDGKAAVLRQVTVDETSATAGQVTVGWTRPTPDTGGQFFAPAGYILQRATQASPAAYTTVRRTADLNDTVFVDRGLNTLANTYTYKLTFFSARQAGAADTLREEAAPAAQVRLRGVPGAGGNVLSWTHAVPWDNTVRPTTVYRSADGGATFAALATVAGTAAGGTYTDTGIAPGQVFCYYVRTSGDYTATGLPKNLVNLSQRLCVTPAPCVPVLSIRATNCDSLNADLFKLGKTPAGFTYANHLRWTVQTDGSCNAQAAYYRLFVQTEAGGPFALLDSTAGTSYRDRDLASAARCYRVQAVDAGGQRSAVSNTACNDNCQLFLLPNIFTPNGDGFNDVFRPKVFSPVVQARVQIFSRWGAKVYDGAANPTTMTLWDGGGARGSESNGGRDTGARAADGLYYYLIEVEFADFKRTKTTFKGWIELTR